MISITDLISSLVRLWCTGRLKIDASNRFIQSILDAESEAILVLGSRKAAIKFTQNVFVVVGVNLWETIGSPCCFAV